jgi:quercetin dioxygenase-like cupin family protein
MSEKKYAKYIMTDLCAPPAPETYKKHEEMKKTGNYFDTTYLFGLDHRVFERGFYTTCELVTKKVGAEPTPEGPAHSHDFDEILMFLGTNPENPHELGGKVELWLEDEQYFLTESCLIFVPKGMKHCPLRYHRVDRPLYFITAGNSTVYEKK